MASNHLPKRDFQLDELMDETDLTFTVPGVGLKGKRKRKTVHGIELSEVIKSLSFYDAVVIVIT